MIPSLPTMPTLPPRATAGPAPVQYSSVLVDGAGSTDANGTYTYRGTNNGKPFYNLAGFGDSVTDAAIFFDGSWTIQYASGLPLYYGGSVEDFPWECEWTVAVQGQGPVPAVTEVA